MTITIHPGWWLLPLAFTLIAFGWARWCMRDSRGGGDYSFGAIADAFVVMLAAIPSLLAWLLWAILT